ncbi:MAG: hypothetical protein K2I83_03660, partial [Bacteroidales bacterium]|nr:hypothetical protein [Bacteroidales bacterium]
MIVFYGLENWQNVYLSRNGRFVFGRSENTGFIYELSSGQFRYFENGYVVGVKDWDNYVTSSYAKIGEEEYFEYTKWNKGSEAQEGNAFTIVSASEDLNTLMATAYMTVPGSPTVTFIIDTKTGDILDTLELFDISPNEVGIVGSGMAMSNDGKIIVGRASMPEANSNFSTALWDRTRGSINYVGTEIVDPGDIASDGELEAVSADGTFAAGDNKDNAYIVRYNPATGTFTTEYIPRWASSDASFAWGVSDNHAVIGAEQTGDAGTRVPYIYFADKEIKYNLNEYCHYLYGLDVEKEISLFTPMSLSSDARIFTGFTAAGSFYPYVVILDATQAYAPALDVQATQNLGTANVQVRWNAPLEGDYEVQGYNVYRGQTKVNTTLVPPADRNTFLDADVPVNSRHWYSVEAVYAEGVAPKSDSVSIYVIDPDGCLPVQNIYSNVVYNRTVQLDWDLPSSETPMSKGVIQTEDAYPAGFFQPGVNTLSAAVKVDDYIYTTTIGGEFTIYDANTHKALKSIEIQGLTAAYDMTYHDGIFWVACN